MRQIIWRLFFIKDKNHIYLVEDSDDFTINDIDEKSLYFSAKKLNWKVKLKT